MQQVIKDFNIKIEEMAPELIDDNATSTTTTTSLVASLWAKHLHNRSSENLSTIEDELNRFNLINIMHCEEDILKFWRSKENTFPKLSKVAKVLFGIPITSAKSESAFSTAGCLLRKDRAAITPYRIEKTLFVHDNYDLFKMNMR